MDKKVELPSDQNGSGRTLGQEELAALAEVIASGMLSSTRGRFVKQLESGFAALMKSAHVHACSSGTAAVHTAVAAINPDPGDEIVVSPITDMGALMPILFQGAIPIFSDVDPRTGNITAACIEPCLSDRTRAIIVTHLFGNPCEMNDILSLANAHGLPVIEDCAQAFMATYHNHLIGSLGTIACFSLQQSKHMTTGEGGLVVTQDERLARNMFLFINKGWGYGDDAPDHYFLALNYRMSELQGAVGVAQLTKLAALVKRRITAAQQLAKALEGVPGIEPPRVLPGCTHSYWRFPLTIDTSRIPEGPVAVALALQEANIPSQPRYFGKPAFMCEVFRSQRTFGSSNYPFNLARKEATDYSWERYPGVRAALDTLLVLPWNERYTDQDVDYMASAIRQAVKRVSITARA